MTSDQKNIGTSTPETATPTPIATLAHFVGALDDYTTTVRVGIVDPSRVMRIVTDIIADRVRLADALREKEAECDRLGQSVKELESFARHIRDSYDHDSDAHKYGTACRVCEADLLLARAQEGKADA